jgi:hypothetical protein
MRVSEVRPGMKGYGLSVFSGVKIERFEVEVISVARNFNLGMDAVLIRASGANLEHTGGIAGMSGSPIYLVDEAGKARLIGAFAYGWDWAKDPVAGVQPIEYMLELADPRLVRAGTSPNFPSPATPASPGATESGKRARWSYFDVAPVLGRRTPVAFPFASRTDPTPNQAYLAAQRSHARDSRHLGLAVSGDTRVSGALAALGPVLESGGLRRLLEAGSGGGLTSGRALPAEMRDVKMTIEPGSTLGASLLSGDLNIDAVGTCTEVIDGKVFGFGHPFNADGGVELPMGGGYVNMVLASEQVSNKMAIMGPPIGVLRADSVAGVGGVLGETTTTIPISVRIRHTDGSVDRTYRYQASRHARLMPVLNVVATMQSMSGVREMPTPNAVRVRSTLALPGGKKLEYVNHLANANPMELFMGLAMPTLALANNPFARVFPESIETEITVEPVERAAEIVSAAALRSRVRAGETVLLDVRYRPVGSDDVTIRVPLKLPENLPAGEYTVLACDAIRAQAEDASARPDRFAAETLDGMLAVLAEQMRSSQDVLQVRLTPPSSGLALGRTGMPRLPGSRQALLGGASNAAAVSEPVVVKVTTPHVLLGSAEVTITVEARPGSKPTERAAVTPGGRDERFRMPTPPPMLPGGPE